GQQRTSLRTVADGVVAVRRIEEIDVVPRRREARVDDLAYLAEAGRRDCAAGAGHLEELRFRELPRIGRMRDEDRLERAVLAPQALHDPEEERLRELAVALGHAARHVEQEEHDGVHGRLPALRELTEAQVLVSEGRDRAFGAAPLHELLERAAPVEARARAAPVPSLARPVGFLGRADARLQVRKLHLLPEPADDVVDLDLEEQLQLAFLAPAGTLARALIARRRAEHIARLHVALADALGLVRSPEPEVVVLEDPHGNPHGPRAFVDHVPAGNDLRQVLADRVADLLVVPQPVPGSAREEVVPTAEADRALFVAAFGHRLPPVRAALGFESLLGQQSRDVAQRFLRAVLIIAVILYQPFLNYGNLLLGFLVRPCRRRDEPQHVSPLLKQILLDGLAHARVARELELLSGLERDHRLAHDLLTERQLAGVGDLDLLLDRAKE